MTVASTSPKAIGPRLTVSSIPPDGTEASLQATQKESMKTLPPQTRSDDQMPVVSETDGARIVKDTDTASRFQQVPYMDRQQLYRYDHSDGESYQPSDRDDLTSVASTDNASLHSRSRFLRRFSLSSSSSTSQPARLRAQSVASPMTDDLTYMEGQRRATVTYLDGLRTARGMSQKPAKTKGRKAVELLYEVVDFVVPIDINDEKTCMEQSSLRQLFKRGASKASVHGSTEAP